MDEFFVYIVPMPDGVREFVTPCADGYTVYIDEKLDERHRMEALQHAVRHAMNGDFFDPDVQQIEADVRR